MKEYKSGKGNEPGNMSPKVEDYQPKVSEFADKQMDKTTEYISRRDRIQEAAANKVRSNSYKGRYD